ncbi:MAG: hypothetical protein IJ056_00625 [Acidaminococcaceae bacterium]|nr:hypothetical protein [Acidaminococcaceae bacterium]
MINRLLSVSGGTAQAGMRAVFLTANFLFAISLLVFVFFICVRMVSSTKRAGYITAGLTGCIFIYRMVWGGGIPPVLFVNHIEGCAGIFCCLAAIVGIFKGLLDEEGAEEYIHGRPYWCSLLLLLYGGFLLISIGTGAAM